ncbi:MAG: hypothetical protein GY713_17880, partial [Actinomycetia bacterium]|nr:hypothetical protein [Actinomycetes bacterium]
AEAAVEGFVGEVEDAAVGGDHEVAGAVGDHADDGGGEGVSGGEDAGDGADEVGLEGEDAAVGGDEPVAGAVGVDDQ